MTSLPVLTEGGPSRAGISRLIAFDSCPQKFAFRHLLRLTPLLEPRGRGLGTVLHIALEHFYRAFIGLPCVDPHEAIRGVHSRYAPYVEPARRIFDAYREWWQPGEQNLKVLAVEYEVAVRVHGHLHTQRFDLVVESNGTAWVWDHKCVPGDAVIRTRRGESRVADLREPTEVLAYRDGEQVWATANTPAIQPAEPVYLIATASGRAVRLGQTHPVLTRRGWVQAGDLCAGDDVAVLVQQDQPEFQPVSDAAAILAGLVLADGHLAENGMTPISWTKRHPAVQQMFLSATDALGIEAARQVVTPGHTTPAWRLQPAAKAWRILRSAGVKPGLSASKRLPEGWQQWSNRQIGLLLGGLWSGDGCAVSRSDGKGIRVVYVSVSERLCRDVQDALLRLGVVSSVTTSTVSYRGERRRYWNTTIVSSESKLRFLSLVASGALPFPRIDPEALRALQERHQPKPSKLRVVDGVLWDPVEVVLYDRVEQTYAIEVPGPATFLVEGVVTHNTSYKVSTQSEWDFSRQFLSAPLVARATFQDLFGLPYGGTVINMLGNRAPYEFARHPLRPPQLEELARCARSIAWSNEKLELLAARQTDPWDYPRTYDCYSRYGTCDYLPLCSQGRAASGGFLVVEDRASPVSRDQ